MVAKQLRRPYISHGRSRQWGVRINEIGLPQSNLEARNDVGSRLQTRNRVVDKRQLRTRLNGVRTSIST